ncbi:hypothetical protein [Marinobacterium arenosum]|uniref:hypothetical protein n=1 Tax=Marinobacterium arenosum TaxID=2862496 RepID=UPI001C97863A|nr:hypothetical protein [Marinobacterium arenosum]MBY4678216.1 hypothetical protein [Marinobacterium arenosum]
MTLISLLAAAYNRFIEHRRQKRAYAELRALRPETLRDIGLRLENGNIYNLHEEALTDERTEQAAAKPVPGEGG